MWTPLFKRMWSCFISETSLSKKLHKQKHCITSGITPFLSFWFRASRCACVCVCVGKFIQRYRGRDRGFVLYADALLTSRSRYSTRSCVRSLSLPGVLVALHSGLDGALHVEERERSGQFLYPVLDGTWRPVGNRLPSSQLPLPVYHRRPRQWCGWLRSFSDLWSTDQTISYLLPSLIALNGCLSDLLACGNKANLAFLCRVKTFSWLFLKCQMIYKLHREILHMQLGIEGGKTLPSSQTGWFLIRLMWNGTKSIFNSHSCHVSFPYQHYSSGRYGSLFPPQNTHKKRIISTFYQNCVI